MQNMHLLQCTARRQQNWPKCAGANYDRNNPLRTALFPQGQGNMQKTKKAPAENWSSEVPTETENLMQLFGMQNVETSAVHHLVLQKV